MIVLFNFFGREPWSEVERGRERWKEGERGGERERERERERKERQKGCEGSEVGKGHRNNVPLIIFLRKRSPAGASHVRVVLLAAPTAAAGKSEKISLLRTSSGRQCMGDKHMGLM